MKRIVTNTIKKEQAGNSLIDFLSGRFNYRSRDQWLEMLNSGHLTINNALPQPDYILQIGDILEFTPPKDFQEPEVATNYEIIYKNKDILVINKPADLPCHPAGPYFNNTLWSLLKTQHDLASIDFINRIDRETSGIVLIAKNKPAAKQLRKDMQNDLFHKEYLAVVEGIIEKPIEAEGYIYRDINSLIRKKKRYSAEITNLPEGEKYQTSHTSITPLCHDKKNSLSLIRAILHTGRNHQIRATLCSLGYPMVGDKIYGVDETIFLRFIEQQTTETDLKLLRIQHQALHAWKLTIPYAGETLSFQAEPPADISNITSEINNYFLAY